MVSERLAARPISEGRSSRARNHHVDRRCIANAKILEKHRVPVISILSGAPSPRDSRLSPQRLAARRAQAPAGRRLLPATCGQRPPLPQPPLPRPRRAAAMALDDSKVLAALGALFAGGIALQLLGCYAYGNWWPLLAALAFVLVPMPYLFFGAGGSASGLGSGWVDAGEKNGRLLDPKPKPKPNTTARLTPRLNLRRQVHRRLHRDRNGRDPKHPLPRGQDRARRALDGARRGGDDGRRARGVRLVERAPRRRRLLLWLLAARLLFID